MKYTRDFKHDEMLAIYLLLLINKYIFSLYMSMNIKYTWTYVIMELYLLKHNMCPLGSYAGPFI